MYKPVTKRNHFAVKVVHKRCISLIYGWYRRRGERLDELLWVSCRNPKRLDVEARASALRRAVKENGAIDLYRYE